jgi:hypothetical protein
MSRHHNKTVVVEMTPEEVVLLDALRVRSGGLPQAEILRIAMKSVSGLNRDWWDAQPRTRIPGGRR